MAGLDEELEINVTEDTARFGEKEKPIRKQFHYWQVSGKEYKMKLTTSMITKLESKYKMNIMNLVMVDGIPPLSVMLTITQAAINPWEHGISYDNVEKMFDKWLEDGGDQQSFFGKIILPTMAVSGFFTKKQTQELTENISEMIETF